MDTERIYPARVIQVIETNLQRIGKGTDEDPARIVRQYWTLDGERLLAQVDSWESAHPTPKDVQG